MVSEVSSNQATDSHSLNHNEEIDKIEAIFAANHLCRLPAEPFLLPRQPRDVGSPTVISVIEEAKSLVQKKWFLLMDVQKDIERLLVMLIGIQAVLGDAEKRRSDSVAVRNWHYKVQHAAYDAKVMLDDFASEISLWQEIKAQVFARLGMRSAVRKFHRECRIKMLLLRAYEISKEAEQFHFQTGDSSCLDQDKSGKNWLESTSDE